MKFELDIKDYDGFASDVSGDGEKSDWVPPLGEQTLSYAQALFLSVSTRPQYFVLTRIE